MRNALRRCDAAFARYYLNQDVEDIQLTLQHLDNDDMMIGKNMPLRVTVKNKSSEDKTVNIVLRADATLYTGATKGCVKKQSFKETIAANSEVKLSADVPYPEYSAHLKDQCSFKVSCLASIPDTQYEFFNEDDFRMMKPDITIKPAPFVVGQKCKCSMNFVNPLPVPLTRPYFYLLASKCRSQFVRVKEDIPVGGTAECEVEMTPTCAGELVLTACFSSKELDDTDGYMTVNVTDGAAAQDGSVNEGLEAEASV